MALDCLGVWYTGSETRRSIGVTKFTNIARLSKFSQISESTVNFVSFLDCEIISEGGWKKLNPERPRSKVSPIG
jgi:hypothetical protein